MKTFLIALDELQFVSEMAKEFVPGMEKESLDCVLYTYTFPYSY
jgi:hypothetical protein